MARPQSPPTDLEFNETGGFFTFRHTPKNGRRKIEKIKTTDRAKAEVKRLEILEAEKTGQTDARKLTFGELATAYFDWADANGRSKAGARRAEWNSRIGPNFDALVVSETEDQDVAAIFRRIQAGTAKTAFKSKGRAKEGPLKASTANQLRAILARVLSWARDEGGLILANCGPRVKRAKEPARNRSLAWDSFDAYERLIPAAMASGNPRLGLFVALGLYTGLRSKQVLYRLRWHHVRFDIWTIEAARLKPESAHEYDRKRVVDVEISPYLYPILQTAYNDTPGTKLEKRNLLVLGKITGLKNEYDALLAALDLEGGAHTMRHTFITHMLREGYSHFAVAKMVGDNPATIAKYYDGTTRNDFRAAYSAFPDPGLGGNLIPMHRPVSAGPRQAPEDGTTQGGRAGTLGDD